MTENPTELINLNIELTAEIDKLVEERDLVLQALIKVSNEGDL